MSLKASLIIPTYQRQQLLGALLDQIEAQSSDEFETLIIDQSPEPAQEIVARTKGNIRLRYFHCSHASLPNARNIGANEAATDILIFIDDDVTLDAEFVAGHLEAFADTSVTATAGRIRGAYDGKDGEPSPHQVGRFSKLTATVTRNFHGSTPVQKIEQLPGGNFAVRRLAYLKIGGFDLVAFGGRASIGEETDFACRLGDAGARIDFVPSAALHHDHAAEGGCRESERKEWTYWHAHNFATLCLRYLPLWAWPIFYGNFLLRYLAHGAKAHSIGVTLSGWRGLFAPFLKVIHPPSEVVAFGEWQEL